MAKQKLMKKATVLRLSTVRVSIDVSVKPQDTTDASTALLTRLPALTWNLLGDTAYRVHVKCGRSESTMHAKGEGSKERLSESELLSLIGRGLKLVGDARIKKVSFDNDHKSSELIVLTHGGRVLVIREGVVADYAETENDD